MPPVTRAELDAARAAFEAARKELGMEPECSCCEVPVPPELAWFTEAGKFVCYMCSKDDDGAYPCAPESYREKCAALEANDGK